MTAVWQFGTIGGIASGVDFTHVATGNTDFGGSSTDVNLSLLCTPRGSKNILSESVLLKQFGIEAPKNPPRLTDLAGETVVPTSRKASMPSRRLHRRRRVPTHTYFVLLCVAGASLPPCLVTLV